ncbi:MAG: malate dehydrogenase (quinone) [Flavobacteriales bacterium]|nr:malate dehydrogenase (quinone) [Flavobacteriales bacterium]MCB9198399.1 malate dehydrogenase (quinone) [Flavobacteriales bacterium]
MIKNNQLENFNVAIIGAGIMGATLGVFLSKLMPFAKIDIFERLDEAGAESSNARNNAGTGHAAYCELNYTPEKEDGTIDLSKALKIAESFELSKQFWAYLVENNLIDATTPFINDIDHMSFVWGKENVEFLEKRHAAMTQFDIFKDMKFSTDHEVLKNWIPLIMNGRDPQQDVAATRMEIGTDVNFGALTKGMIKYLEDLEQVDLFLSHQIEDIKRRDDERWEIEVTDLKIDDTKSEFYDFVFIGAGGATIPLLEKTDIPESKGYGGFPVSGQFLICDNPEVIEQHEAKVYGKAEVGSPPMSVPHLDTRYIDGKRSLLYGPYAGFSTKFLKNGSVFDLFLSIESHNIWPLLAAGYHNYKLTKYLVKQVVQSDEDRFEMLQKFYPEAKFEDWKLITAGQRVQIIKEDDDDGGKLQFGTEVVTSEDGSMSALLGASPGASTSVGIMLDLLKKCFPLQMESQEWQTILTEMIPSYGRSLIDDGELCLATRERTTKVLKLEYA